MITAPETTSLPAIHLRGVRLHGITETQCISHVIQGLDAGQGGWVVTANRRITSAASLKTLLT